MKTSNVCPMEVQRSNNPQQLQDTVLGFKIPFPTEKPEFLEEMANTRSGADPNTVTFSCATKQGSIQTIRGTHQKDTKVDLGIPPS